MDSKHRAYETTAENPDDIGSTPTLTPRKLSEESCVEKQESSTTSAENTNNGIPKPPDGGLQAWLQLLCGFCVYSITWGFVYSFGAFQTYYVQRFAGTRSASSVSWIGSLQVCMLFFVSVITGPLYDLGYLRSLLVVGSTCTVLGYILTSVSETFLEILFTQGFLVGIGSGCLFVCCVTVLGQWFSKRRSLVLGIAACGGPIGGIIWTFVFTRTLSTLGFGWSTRLIGIIALVISLVVVVFMKPLLPPSSVRSLKLTRTLCDAPFLAWCAGVIFSFSVIFNYMFYVALYGTQKFGMTSYASSNLVLIFNAGSVLGRLAIMPFGDYIGSVNTMVVMAFIASILGFCWIAITNVASTIVVGIIYGTVAAVYAAIPAAAVVSLSGTIEGLGTRLAVSLIAGGIGTLFGPPVSGLILHSHLGWLGLQCFTGGMMVIGAILILFSRVMKVGWSLKKPL